jgi:hypothetical protein
MLLFFLNISRPLVFSPFLLQHLQAPVTRLWTHTSQEPLISSTVWNTTAIQGCIQKFPDWPPGSRTANGTALCHYVQLCRYFVSQSSEFCRHNPLYCFTTSNTKGKRISRCRFSPETFGYTIVLNSQFDRVFHTLMKFVSKDTARSHTKRVK